MSKKNKLLKLFSVVTLLCAFMFFTLDALCLSDDEKISLLDIIRTGFSQNIGLSQENQEALGDQAWDLYLKLERCKNEDEIYHMIMIAQKGTINLSIINVLIKNIPSIALELIRIAGKSANIVTYNNFIRAAASIGHFDEAYKTYIKVTANRLANDYTYNIFISAAANAGHFDKMHNAYNEAVNYELTNDITTSIYINALVLEGNINKAESLFSRLHKYFLLNRYMFDLHGLNFGETYIAMHLLARSTPINDQFMLIIGKGLHSKDEHIIKRAVELFVKQHTKSVKLEANQSNIGIVKIKKIAKYNPSITMSSRFSYTFNPRENESHYNLRSSKSTYVSDGADDNQLTDAFEQKAQSDQYPESISSASSESTSSASSEPTSSISSESIFSASSESTSSASSEPTSSVFSESTSSASSGSTSSVSSEDMSARKDNNYSLEYDIYNLLDSASPSMPDLIKLLTNKKLDLDKRTRLAFEMLERGLELNSINQDDLLTLVIHMFKINLDMHEDQLAFARKMLVKKGYDNKRAILVIMMLRSGEELGPNELKAARELVAKKGVDSEYQASLAVEMIMNNVELSPNGLKHVLKLIKPKNDKIIKSGKIGEIGIKIWTPLVKELIRIGQHLDTVELSIMRKLIIDPNMGVAIDDIGTLAMRMIELKYLEITDVSVSKSIKNFVENNKLHMTIRAGLGISLLEEDQEINRDTLLRIIRSERTNKTNKAYLLTVMFMKGKELNNNELITIGKKLISDSDVSNGARFGLAYRMLNARIKLDGAALQTSRDFITNNIYRATNPIEFCNNSLVMLATELLNNDCGLGDAGIIEAGRLAVDPNGDVNNQEILLEEMIKRNLPIGKDGLLAVQMLIASTKVKDINRIFLMDTMLEHNIPLGNSGLTSALVVILKSKDGNENNRVILAINIINNTHTNRILLTENVINGMRNLAACSKVNPTYGRLLLDLLSQLTNPSASSSSASSGSTPVTSASTSSTPSSSAPATSTSTSSVSSGFAPAADKKESDINAVAQSLERMNLGNTASGQQVVAARSTLTVNAATNSASSKSLQAESINSQSTAGKSQTHGASQGTGESMMAPVAPLSYSNTTSNVAYAPQAPSSLSSFAAVSSSPSSSSPAGQSSLSSNQQHAAPQAPSNNIDQGGSATGTPSQHQNDDHHGQAKTKSTTNNDKPQTKPADKEAKSNASIKNQDSSGYSCTLNNEDWLSTDYGVIPRLSLNKGKSLGMTGIYSDSDGITFNEDNKFSQHKKKLKKIINDIGSYDFGNLIETFRKISSDTAEMSAEQKSELNGLMQYILYLLSRNQLANPLKSRINPNNFKTGNNFIDQVNFKVINKSSQDVAHEPYIYTEEWLGNPRGKYDYTAAAKYYYPQYQDRLMQQNQILVPQIAQ